MGQVITFLPLMDRKIIIESEADFNNLVKANANLGTPKSIAGLPKKKTVSRSRPMTMGTVGGGAVPIGNLNNPPADNTTPPDDSVPVTPDYNSVPDGGENFGIGGGFPTDSSGDFEAPATDEEYPVLGTDSYGCPYYGLDEAGRPLYGVDQNGNVITDPTVLPCGMKGQEAPVSDTSPVSQIANDKTLKTALLVVAGLVVFTLLAKK